MYKSLQSLAGESRVSICGVLFAWKQRGSCSFNQPRGNETGLFLELYMFFPCSKNSLFLLDCWSVHSLLPSLPPFKTGQAVGVWWINHEQSAVGSLRLWNLLNWVVGRTANNKGSVTCGLTSSHFWGLLFLIRKPKICMFTLINPLDSWTFSLLFSLPTHIDRDEGREAKSTVISETLWKYCACKRTIWNLSKHSKSGF